MVNSAPYCTFRPAPSVGFRSCLATESSAICRASSVGDSGKSLVGFRRTIPGSHRRSRATSKNAWRVTYLHWISKTAAIFGCCTLLTLASERRHSASTLPIENEIAVAAVAVLCDQFIHFLLQRIFVLIMPLRTFSLNLALTSLPTAPAAFHPLRWGFAPTSFLSFRYL